MAGQHSENLFRRFKGRIAIVKTVSGDVYEGRITEITNDYVCFSEVSNAPAAEVYIFFNAIESVNVPTASS